jgi:hypothetical protein
VRSRKSTLLGTQLHPRLSKQACHQAQANLILTISLRLRTLK